MSLSERIEDAKTKREQEAVLTIVGIGKRLLYANLRGREHEIKIYYRGVEVGTRRVDFFVEERVMVQIKAVVELDDAHLAQAKNYLEAYGLQVGMLLNFGGRSLQYKRVMPRSV